MTSHRLTFCDLSPFYCDAGGGIRTYHRARLSWFSNQTRYRYVLVSPGPAFRVERLTSSVTTVQVYGPQLTRHRDGYRLMLAWTGIRDVLRWLSPDVLETGDPWMSGPLGLHLRRRGIFKGLLSSFYHSDPIATYVRPWIDRTSFNTRIRARVLTAIERRFYQLQQRFDVTLAASREVGRRLAARGVSNVVHAAMGADPLFFHVPRARSRGGPVALLYAGRLDADKDVGLLLQVMNRLLRRPDVTVTVAGRGRHESAFAAISHPRYSFRGYIADRPALAALYGESDIFLATGRHETFGLAALEAAASGLIVVGPDEGGTGELLSGLTSPFTFRAGADAFLQSILAAVESDRGRESERSRALAWSHGSWPQAIAKQAALYAGLVEARH